MRIRPAVESDAAAIADVYGPYVLETTISFELEPPDAGDMRSRMRAEPRLPWFVADRDGLVVGYAYASQHRSRLAYRWSVDVSVYLAGSERRRGTGRALYDTLLPALRDLGYVQAFAGVTLPNEASVGLHEALGFTPVGVYRAVGFKDGRWHDVGWWQLPLTDPPVPPADPQPWA